MEKEIMDKKEHLKEYERHLFNEVHSSGWKHCLKWILLLVCFGGAINFLNNLFSYKGGLETLISFFLGCLGLWLFIKFSREEKFLQEELQRVRKELNDL